MMKNTKEMEAAINKYKNIEIPDELGNVVEEAISKGKHGSTRAAVIYFRRAAAGILAAAAATVIIIAAGCNMSQTFAEDAGNIPVIGSIARILTVRQYVESVNDGLVEVEIPAIDETSINSKFTNEVNTEIEKKCNDYADRAKQYAEEYRQAFLDTGGTEAEWKEHDNKIMVSYKVMSNTADHVSFKVTGYTSWSAADAETTYYNLDLASGRYITLKDLLGDDYISKANASISSQIDELKKKPDNQFFDGDEGFKTISDDTKFYINDAGNPVVVFDKYEIAPGSMGEMEFEIQRGN